MADAPNAPAPSDAAPGAQRLSIEALRDYEALGFGMFIHFGMSTFDGDELSRGDQPASLYAPDRLDVDQWVRVAADAGMTYAVLTAKHVAGHCLWPTAHNDYHVGVSGNKTDVVGAFVEACRKHGVKPGLYYCSWDNHNRFGSVTPTFAAWDRAFTTAEYREFQRAQIEELLTGYGPLVEMWIDIPRVLGPDGRRKLYDEIARLAPQTMVVMNNGIQNGRQVGFEAWPTDVTTIERFLPPSNRGYNPWHRIGRTKDDDQRYYIPAEVCDPIGYEWFHRDDDPPRSDAELLGMRLICEARGVNLLLNVPPDRSGRIPDRFVDALDRLKTHHEKVT